jgi:uncharacterized protein (TIGR02271 family)
MTNRTTVVGVFQDRAQAQKAIDELKRAGFREDEIGMTVRDSGSIERADTGAARDDAGGETHATEGAAAGLAAGAGVGALWGLGIVAIGLPAIGPAIAGGALAAVLSSAVAGATAAGTGGALIGLGIPKEEAEYYESEFKAGRTLVTVKTTTRQDEAMAIMRGHGGYDMGSRHEDEASTLGQGAYAGKQPMTTQPSGSVLKNESGAYGGAGRASTDVEYAQQSGASQYGSHEAAKGQTFEAREEELRVHKDRQQGEVRVTKEVHTEHKTLDVPVEREEVVVERHPASGQPASGSVGRGEEIRIPVSEEHVHVEKSPVVKEEVTVGKQKTRDTKHVEADVRKEEIRVEKDTPGKGRGRK